jgi:hypothetical protein
MEAKVDALAVITLCFSSALRKAANPQSANSSRKAARPQCASCRRSTASRKPQKLPFLHQFDLLEA